MRDREPAKTWKEAERRLKEPFVPTDLEWKIQTADMGRDGKPYALVVTYLTSRAIMDRLDEVFGIGGWSNSVTITDKGDTLCALSLTLEGVTVQKMDGADQTDIEGTKGGISGAIKRSGVLAGIGRYLYDLPKSYAIISEAGQNNYWRRADSQKNKPELSFRWDPPALPKWALPSDPLKDKCFTIGEAADLKVKAGIMTEEIRIKLGHRLFTAYKAKDEKQIDAIALEVESLKIPEKAPQAEPEAPKVGAPEAKPAEPKQENLADIF